MDNTIIICTRNRPAQLSACLEAVSRLRTTDYKVLVVDNAPSDDQSRAVAARWEAAYVIEPVAGLSRARNLGVRVSGTDVVAFLDDDAIPDSDWLVELTREFEDPMVMAVAGRNLAVRIETQAELLSASIGGFASGGPERRVVDRETPCWFELANFGGIVHGTNMAFRRRAFELWDGFDVRLGPGAFLYGEEHRAFFELIERGFRVVYTPHALVHHAFPRTMPELRARHLADRAAAVGYLTLLFVEEPRYRMAVLKYLFEAARGKPRTWRGQFAVPRPRFVPRWREVLACLSGPWRYALSCLQAAIRNRSGFRG